MPLLSDRPGFPGLKTSLLNSSPENRGSSGVLRQKLATYPDDEEFLFVCGCHVFADELFARLGHEGFSLRRLADIAAPSENQAIHVYVCRGDTMLDVEGSRPEKQFIKDVQRFRRGDGQPKAHLKAFGCSRDELFLPGPQNFPEARNQWGLIIDPEFVADCRRRAVELIHRFPEKYGLPGPSL